MPLSEPPEVRSAPDLPPRVPFPRPDRVLVVGDDPLVSQHIVEQILEQTGIEADTARWVSDYPEAMEEVTIRPPALVVVDQLVDDEDPLGSSFLRFLSELDGDTPRVILLRYAPSPVGVPGTLDVTVVGGESWFEDLLESVRPPPFDLD